MSVPRPDIFISATSADLAPIRELIKHAVLDLGAHPIEQAHSSPARESVAGTLREKIVASHAVIHLVGECYGLEDPTTPAAREHGTYAQGRRSYTQLEHDWAVELGKPLYIFLCGENFPYTPHPPEPEELQQLQRDHRARLLGGTHLYRHVEQPGELRELVLRLEERTRALAERAGRSEKRLARTLVLGGLALVLLGGGLFYLKQRSDESTRAVEAERRQNESQARQLATQQAQLAQMQKDSAAQMDLVRAVLAKVEGSPGRAGSQGKGNNLGAAQAEVARERGETLEILRQQLAAAETNAAERVHLAAEIEKRATAEIAAARDARRLALRDLGDAALANLKYPEAVEHYRAAAALYHRATEPLPWAAAQAKLAAALWRHGKYRDAAAVYQEVLAERERLLPAEHPAVLSALNDLAVVRQDTGDDATAEALYRRALQTCERVFGAEHSHTLLILNNLAVLLRARGDYAAAEPLYRRVLEARERVLGAEHPETLTAVNNLAALLYAKGDYGTAEPLFRRALAVNERALGAEHPATLTNLNNLAELLRARGDYESAEPLYRRGLAARERVLGAEHPDTLASVNNLALLLRARRDYEAAEPLYRRALAAWERILGAEHPATCLTAYNLAQLLVKEDKKAEAVPLAWQAYRGWRKSKGAEHEDTRDARELLLDLGETVPEAPEAKSK